ncbi:MAG: hypothetical protein HY033_00445 [Ignavibacteriae bacterium]|nr:hypothetical protein [Ignavibacteria bacterium]MBI3363357.1 hypothetical protein [Ignavibacteriota bacterium]
MAKPETLKIKELFRRVSELYEHHDYHHALAILSTDFPIEFSELCNALIEFRLTKEQIKKPGGNESEIPKAFSHLLRKKGWEERKLTAKLVVDESDVVSEDTHLIDFVKGRVAFDLEWNSKDQTFDRDLYAFRAFFEYNKISVAVLVTRSNDLDGYIDALGEYSDKHGETRTYKSKFGASTTHMGKLIPRLNAGRGGGCPVLAMGITRKLIHE